MTVQFRFICAFLLNASLNVHVANVPQASSYRASADFICCALHAASDVLFHCADGGHDMSMGN